MGGPRDDKWRGGNVPLNMEGKMGEILTCFEDFEISTLASAYTVCSTERGCVDTSALPLDLPHPCM